MVQGLIKIAEAHNSTPSQVALAWVLSRPTISAVIVGANSAEQLEETLKVSALTLNVADLEEMTQLSHWQK